MYKGKNLVDDPRMGDKKTAREMVSLLLRPSAELEGTKGIKACSQIASNMVSAGRGKKKTEDTCLTRFRSTGEPGGKQGKKGEGPVGEKKTGWISGRMDGLSGG